MPVGTLCIAGKGGLAVRALYMADRLLGREVPILVIPNMGDDGTDRWQPSLLRHAEAIGGRVEITQLENVYNSTNGIFLSLEFDKIIKIGQFNGWRLFNVHFSKLPAYKGMYTSYHPLANGEKESGCTLHLIDRGIDTGDIVDQISFALSPSETAKSLYSSYVRNGHELLERNFSSLLSGDFAAHPQPAYGSTYYSKNSVDYRSVSIDLKDTAHSIMRQVNAFNHRSYQLPMIFERPISYVSILADKSVERPGSIISQTEWSVRIATVDFDCELIVDRFDELLDAVLAQNLDTISSIVERNPSLLSESDDNGWTPVIRASYMGLSSSLKRLIELGADVNLSNEKGTTPLMYAKDNYIRSGDDTTVRILLTAGADADAVDITNRTVFDYVDQDQASLLRQLVGKCTSGTQAKVSR